jgi:hypothetical protein
MSMRRYLVVLDMDFLAADEKLELEPINYLIAQQEREPCQAVVLSLAHTREARLPGAELLLGAQVGKFPVAPRPRHDLGAAAGHRMSAAVRHLNAIGCQASGFISDEEGLLKAVRSEIRSRDYAEVLLVTGRKRGSWLSRALRLDPVRRLRRRLGRQLIVFPLGPDAPHPTLPGDHNESRPT